MTSLLVVLGALLHAGGGLVAWAVGRRAFTAATVAALIGGGAIAAAGILALGGADPAPLAPAWPMGGIALAVDALSGAFLVPIGVLGALAAVYARGYWDAHASAGRTRFALGLLVAAMALVVTARQGLWFLACWEAMALAGWLALTAEHRDPAVRRAGWIYLAFTHAGTACLLAMTALLAQRSGGSLAWEALAGGAHPLDGAIVLLAVIGFGAKAGLLPLHAWLPGAHASAPSHASALLSGVMLTTGIYGIMRVTMLLPEPAAWWGGMLVVVGAASALYGIASALAQADLKRLLACSSIENLGIAALAVGLAVMARAAHRGDLAALAAAAAILHLWHHAAFKGLLFLGAGCVVHGTGTRAMDRLGGLLARMPFAGGLMLIGCAAAAALPGLAGFASEWPIYLAAFADLRLGGWAGVVVVVALALAGGLALAAYAKLYGSVFLGAARTPAGERAHEPGLAMRSAMLPLALACVVLPLALPFTLPALAPAVAAWGVTAPAAEVPSAWLAIAGATILLGLGLLWLALRRALAARRVRSGVTWDCGYAAPDPRMQYTARSFTAVIGGDFAPPPIRPETRVEPARGLFPGLARLVVTSGDGVLDRVLRPAALRVAGWCQRLRLLQQGILHAYLAYVLVTVIVLLAVARCSLRTP